MSRRWQGEEERRPRPATLLIAFPLYPPPPASVDDVLVKEDASEDAEGHDRHRPTAAGPGLRTQKLLSFQLVCIISGRQLFCSSLFPGGNF